MNLSKTERLLLSNQFKILESLYPDEAKYYSRHRKAVEEGYILHYEWLAEHLYEETSVEECEEVLRILKMYRAINDSAHRLTGDRVLIKDRIKFPGFDGNNEGNQYSYVRYFLLDLGRFQELHWEGDFPSLNSHGEMLPHYRRMMEKWEKFPDTYKLTEEQVLDLIGRDIWEQ